MAELGIGIIGLGRMGWIHAEHLNGAVRGTRLIGAAVDEAQRRQLELSGEAPCPLFESVEDLVDDPRVDAVVVVSPTSFHHEHIQLAAARRKAIFAEKPLADSVPHAIETAASVQRAGVPFQIGFQRRFDPGYSRARSLIESGAIGEPEMFRGLSCDRIPPVSYLKTSGGLFWDLGIHDFDAARFLIGDEVVRVSASGTILVEPELATFDDVDHGVVILHFRRGGIGVVQNAWRAPYGYDIRAEVHGSQGKVVTDLDEKVPTRLYGPQGFTSERHMLFVERFEEAYRLELQAFVDAVKNDRTPTPGIEDAVQGVLVAEAATQSHRTGQSVHIAMLTV